MTTITIPENLIGEKDLIVIPRKQYEVFLDVGRKWGKRLSEEQDTDEAINVYKKEKKEGELRMLKSLKSLLFASESSLSKDWLKKAEERAWQNL